MAAFTLDKLLILDRLGGDEEIFAMMIDMYLQDVDNYCTCLDKAYAAGDMATLQREAHTVKGLLSTFADDEGTAMSFTLEQQIKSSGMGDFAAPIAALKQRLHDVAAVLRVEQAGQA